MSEPTWARDLSLKTESWRAETDTHRYRVDKIRSKGAPPWVWFAALKDEAETSEIGYAISRQEAQRLALSWNAPCPA